MIEVAKKNCGPIVVRGTVIHGQKIGKKFDLPPTMNIATEVVVAELKEGIYCVTARRTAESVRSGEVADAPRVVENPVYKGVLHYGPRPAVNAPKSFEVHLFDFNDDWYGAAVEVNIGQFIREVQNFKSIEDLKFQIEKDIEIAKNA